MADVAITPIQMDGELRILDVNLADRLGFAQPRDIRKLIKRYGAELDRMGRRATVARRPETGGHPTIETYLNKKQAIFITAKSETPEATDITIEIIHKFDAYEQGISPSVVAAASPRPRDPQWSAWLTLPIDERNSRRQDAKMYRSAYGAVGERYAMYQVGMPMLPDELMAPYEQYEIDFARTYSISMVMGGVQ